MTHTFDTLAFLGAVSGILLSNEPNSLSKLHGVMETILDRPIWHHEWTEECFNSIFEKVQHVPKLYSTVSALKAANTVQMRLALAELFVRENGETITVEID